MCIGVAALAFVVGTGIALGVVLASFSVAGVAAVATTLAASTSWSHLALALTGMCIGVEALAFVVGTGIAFCVVLASFSVAGVAAVATLAVSSSCSHLAWALASMFIGVEALAFADWSYDMALPVCNFTAYCARVHYRHWVPSVLMYALQAARGYSAVLHMPVLYVCRKISSIGTMSVTLRSLEQPCDYTFTGSRATTMLQIKHLYAECMEREISTITLSSQRRTLEDTLTLSMLLNGGGDGSRDGSGYGVINVIRTGDLVGMGRPCAGKVDAADIDANSREVEADLASYGLCSVYVNRLAVIYQP